MDATVSGISVEAVEHPPGSGTVRTQFDKEKTPASMAIIATLADLLDTDPIALDPLYSTVDPDALDALFGVRYATTGEFQLAFTHEGHAITVYSSGVITIRSKQEPTANNCETDAGTDF